MNKIKEENERLKLIIKFLHSELDKAYHNLNFIADNYPETDKLITEWFNYRTNEINEINERAKVMNETAEYIKKMRRMK